jgi:pimeloyl-ACP methyl ester carboxylesterase
MLADMRPRHCTALLAAALLAPAAVLAACGGSDPAPKAPGATALQRCAKVPDLPAARCGTVEVPLDRANPSAGTTTVAFALVPRRDTAAPSAGTLAFNPGGPGDPTIANAAETAKMFAPLLDHRDLLLIDPRGTGRSDALHCATGDHPRLQDVFASPTRAFEAIGQCGRELGPHAANYGTREVADDFEAVRAELGVDRLDLWGNSYGTYLMPVYAARHPEHVRSMVLSGAYPTDFDPWGRDRAAAARRAIGLICARTHGCDESAVLRDVAALATRLRHHPVTFDVAVEANHFRGRLDENAVAALMYAGGSPYGLAQLPAIAASGRVGDLAPLRRVVETKLLTEAYGVTHPVASEDSLPQAFATECHDFPRAFSLADPPTARRAAYEKARDALDQRAFAPFSASAWTNAGFEAGATCIAWPDVPSAAAPLEPGTAMPDVPVLVISGDLDANTPSSAGRQVAARFARATFAEIPNVGHVPTDASPCALKLGLHFVATTAADANACAGTGAPPPLAPTAPVRATDLTSVKAPSATPAERRTLAVIVATASDLQQQVGMLDGYGTARALRGGRYIRAARGVRLAGVRVVRDASVSGTLVPTEGKMTGTVRLTGAGVAHGTLRVAVSGTGASRATGTLAGRRVRLSFRIGG